MVNSAGLAALALFVVLALGKVRAFDPTIDPVWGAQWREAAEIVEPRLKEGRAVDAGFPSFAAAVQYYLRDDPAVNPALIQLVAANADTLILADRPALDPKRAATIAGLHQAFPHVVAHLQGVWVLRR